MKSRSLVGEKARPEAGALCAPSNLCSSFCVFASHSTMEPLSDTLPNNERLITEYLKSWIGYTQEIKRVSWLIRSSRFGILTVQKADRKHSPQWAHDQMLYLRDWWWCCEEWFPHWKSRMLRNYHHYWKIHTSLPPYDPNNRKKYHKDLVWVPVFWN